jgi:hypothetical protein
MADRYNVENHVVNQKNAIICNINAGEYDAALARLSILTDLWVAVDYAYKGHELCDRIIAAVYEESANLHPRSNAAKRVERLDNEARKLRSLFIVLQAVNA